MTDVVRAFENALYDGDVKAAGVLCVPGKRPPGVLEALAGERHGDQGFCTVFRSITGSDPTLSRRVAMERNLDSMDVYFGDDVAETFWGQFPLRKFNGKWRIDLAEYDYEFDLTDQLDYLRALPEMYRSATDDLKARRESRSWIAEANLEDFKHRLCRKYETVLSKADDVRSSRMTADVQGRWDATVKPYKSETSPQPAWPEFRCTIEVSGQTLKVTSTMTGLASSARLTLGVTGLGFQAENPGKQTWDLVKVRVLGKLRGTLVHEHGDEVDVYEVTGTASK